MIIFHFNDKQIISYRKNDKKSKNLNQTKNSKTKMKK